ncbi:alpha/beta fold hydrolase [Hymenobacter sp. NBH84]|uniref:alpha/beta hydrolase family protein n=1 Tax=Hymenobacter sp. NBH84 TaxID=2596915 RepID=UPI001629A9B3|nr:alpha/beta fold hydrolase [Hymenobacter sp. NBH84]QNE40883.1 alpha/beta fold hydrolase [Hymenobacter sp. NBH84]
MISKPTTYSSGRWLLLWLLLLLAGCQSTSDDPQPAPASGQDLFVSATKIVTAPKTLLQAAATSAGFGNYAQYVQYDVTFYKLIYKTTFQGKEIQASGLVGVPLNTPKPPALLSAQHGTIFRLADAPSNFPNSFSGFELFAGAGFATVIPDFIGFGASDNIFHPYFDQPASAAAVVDMLKATQYYLQSQQTALNDHLFLVGYSEGGYVTMAAQKEIETTTAHNLTLTAVAAGAGGYDLPEMLTGIATTPTYATPAFLAFILQAYNTTYGWNRPLTDFFQQPYAGRLPGLLDGSKALDEIDASLTTKPAELFAPAFYTNLQNGTSEADLRQKLRDNSFLTWVPKSPTRLFHGTADESVFYQTSETTFKRFQAAGAANVEFIPIPGGMHRTSIAPMMLNVLPWFQSLDK